MINIQNPNDCCGCGACVAICPKKCISMQNNEEGFLYPSVDITKCIDCGLCNKVCSWENKPELLDRLVKPSVYAAWNLDENVRRNSSSGGIFSAIAEKIFEQDGIVIGAAYVDDFKKVKHILINSPNNIYMLRGSKYVQSEVAPEVYNAIKCGLKEGKKILFTGTPCQVAGLRNYLGKADENFITCDLVCAGVPSPELHRKLILETQKIIGSAHEYFSFRSKNRGWGRFYTIHQKFKNGKEIIQNGSDNLLCKLFSLGLNIRYSCFNCKFKSLKRSADITIADFWEVEKKYPEYNKDKLGTSLVLINTKKGENIFNEILSKIFIGAADIETALSGNPMLEKNHIKPRARKNFFKKISVLSIEEINKKYNNKSIINYLLKIIPNPIKIKIKYFIKK